MFVCDFCYCEFDVAICTRLLVAYAVAVPVDVLVDSESAQFWRHCAGDEHVLFCSSDSFVTQLQQRLLTRFACRDVTLSTLRSVFLRKSLNCLSNLPSILVTSVNWKQTDIKMVHVVIVPGMRMNGCTV